MPFDGKDYVKTNTVADVLRRARALIDSPEKWLRGAYTDGHRYCSIGALRTAAGNFIGDDGREARDLLRDVCGGDIVFFNDYEARRHADVMAAFDKAIALAEAGE